MSEFEPLHPLEAAPEFLTPAETLEYQASQLRECLVEAMVDGQSDSPWAPDLLKDLNFKVEEIVRRGEAPPEEVVVKTYADLNHPQTWQNQTGEMDAVNLFFERMGTNRADVLKAIENKAQRDQQLSGTVKSDSVVFESDITGVSTKVKYAYAESGELAYIQPEILVDTTVEVEVEGF